MQNRAEAIAMAIERDHPGWVVTVLFRATQPPLYCARHSGEPLTAYRSEDPDDLSDLIEGD